MEQAAFQSMQQLQDRHWWYVGRRRFIEQLIRRRAGLPANARILEAGCGPGGNLELLRQFGEVSAFEYDEGAREFASAATGIEVRPGHLPDAAGFDGEKFDLIAMLDVLEHIEDDHGSLLALSRLLAPDGKLLITVPAHQWLWSDHDEIHHHKRRYGNGQLRDLLSGAGYEIGELGYFNSLLFPVAVAQRLVSRAVGGKSGGGEVSNPLNSLLKNVFSWEAKTVGKLPLPIGLSLYALASAR